MGQQDPTAAAAVGSHTVAVLCSQSDHSQPVAGLLAEGDSQAAAAAAGDDS